MSEQPSYSTKPLHRFPAQDQFFHVDLENEWDSIAEAVICFSAQPNTKVYQLILLLESHGIVVHELPTAESTVTSSNIRSPFVPSPPDDPAQIPRIADYKTSFFPRDVVLVHGTRVIEAPPPLYSGLNPDQNFDLQNVNALFTRLETAGVEVVRWPNSLLSKGNVLQERLVDVGESQSETDKEEEGPRFCPSDILVLSRALLITRLSAFTNNKGLEYLWSVLSRPSQEEAPVQHNGARTSVPRANSLSPARNTTLLVRVTDPDTPTLTPSAPPTPSSRTTTFRVDDSKSAITGYVPLSRALVPISANVMLYDPALIADNEARRLKSVLDRIQEDSRGIGGSDAADSGGFLRGEHLNRRGGMSYGTFGIEEQTDGNDWQFISVNGLHSISILLVSPQLALLSPVLSSPSTAGYPAQEDLSQVTEVLESHGVRAVKLRPEDLDYSKPDRGVRDAVLALRREPNLEASANGNDLANLDGQQQQGEEGAEEGCLDILCASLSALLCQSLTSSGASDADVSEHN